MLQISCAQTCFVIVSRFVYIDGFSHMSTPRQSCLFSHPQIIKNFGSMRKNSTCLLPIFNLPRSLSQGTPPRTEPKCFAACQPTGAPTSLLRAIRGRRRIRCTERRSLPKPNARHTPQKAPLYTVCIPSHTHAGMRIVSPSTTPTGPDRPNRYQLNSNKKLISRRQSGLSMSPMLSAVGARALNLLARLRRVGRHSLLLNTQSRVRIAVAARCRACRRGRRVRGGPWTPANGFRRRYRARAWIKQNEEEGYISASSSVRSASRSWSRPREAPDSRRI